MLFSYSRQLYAEKVAVRGLCAIAQCESLRYKLLGGLAVRRYDPCSMLHSISVHLLLARAMVSCDLSWRAEPLAARSSYLASSELSVQRQ